MLARLATSTSDQQSADSEAAIEKYLRSLLAVENLLAMDRLRQVGQFPYSPPNRASAFRTRFQTTNRDWLFCRFFFFFFRFY